jgi:hypothetical protein
MSTRLNKDIAEHIQRNNNRITPSFIDTVAESAEVIHLHPTANTRICMLKLPSGHELVGIAQVLDADNDVETIGQSVAYGNAKEQLWKLCGTIAKLYI